MPENQKFKDNGYTYTKNEVDQMIELALKRFDERTYQMRNEFQQSLKEMREDFHQMRLEMHREIKEITDKTIQRLTINIGIIVTLLSILNTVLHFGVR